MYIHTQTYTDPQNVVIQYPETYRDTWPTCMHVEETLSIWHYFTLSQQEWLVFCKQRALWRDTYGSFINTHRARLQVWGIFCGYVKLFCRYVGLCDSASQGLFPRKCVVPLSRGPYIHTCTCMQTYRHTSMDPHVHTSTRSESALGVAQQRKTHAYTYTFIYAFIHVCQICTMMFAAK